MRWFLPPLGRLFSSTAVATCVVLVLVSLSLMSPQLRQPTLVARVWDWVMDFVQFSNFFADNMPGTLIPKVYNSRYLDLLRTIPVEFRGSMVLFTFLAAVSKLLNKNRILSTAGFVLVYYIWKRLGIHLDS